MFDVRDADTTGGEALMGFKGIQSVAGLYDEQSHEAALWLAENAASVTDGWELLEICGLLPYESAKPSGKSRGEKAPVIKYPRVGQ